MINIIVGVETPTLYIDDRTICFKGNYQQTLDEVAKFKVYWQQ